MTGPTSNRLSQFASRLLRGSCGCVVVGDSQSTDLVAGRMFEGYLTTLAPTVWSGVGTSGINGTYTIGGTLNTVGFGNTAPSSGVTDDFGQVASDQNIWPQQYGDSGIQSADASASSILHFGTISASQRAGFQGGDWMKSGLRGRFLLYRQPVRHPSTVANRLSGLSPSTLVLSDGASVTAWSDAVGGRSWAQLGGAPTYRSVTITAPDSSTFSQSVVRFVSSSNQFLHTSSAVSYSADFDIFAVSVSTASSNNDYIMGNNSTSEYFRVGFFGTQEALLHDGSLVVQSSAFGSSITNRKVIRCSRSGSTLSFYENATARGTGSSSHAFTIDNLGNSAGGTSLDADIGDIHTYSRQLSSTEAAQVQVFLSTAYGVAIADNGVSGTCGVSALGFYFTRSPSDSTPSTQASVSLANGDYTIVEGDFYDHATDDPYWRILAANPNVDETGHNWSLMGVQYLTPSETDGLRLCVSAVGGTGASHHIEADRVSDASRDEFVSFFGVDTVIIHLFQNETINDMWRDDILALIEKWRSSIAANGGDARFLLITGWQATGSNAAKVAAASGYLLAISQADSTVSWFGMGDVDNGFALANGYLSDGVHQANLAASQYFAGLLNTALVQALAPVTTVAGVSAKVMMKNRAVVYHKTTAQSTTSAGVTTSWTAGDEVVCSIQSIDTGEDEGQMRENPRYRFDVYLPFDTTVRYTDRLVITAGSQVLIGRTLEVMSYPTDDAGLSAYTRVVCEEVKGNA